MAEVFKILKLDMTGIPESRRKSAKRSVLNVIENETTRSLSKGQSPVRGEVFIKLTKDYAEGEKQGDRTPNLQLEGDLLEAIEYKTLPGDDIGWGYSNSNIESEKADGHNQFSASAKKPIWKNGNKKLPKRRYIPEKNQRLKPSIEKKIDNELDKFRKVNRPTERALDIDIDGNVEDTSINISGQLFSDETIVSELLREIAIVQS